MNANTKICPICGEPPAAKRGGLCPACRSWWTRVQLYNPRELSAYLFRLRRFGQRAHVMDTKREQQRILPFVRRRAAGGSR